MEDFEKFRVSLCKAFEMGLPGKPGQEPMRPYLKLNKSLDAPEPFLPPKEGAVLALIYPKENFPHLALIERPVYEGIHSGQIAFPGGKVEKGETAVEAALREASEEVGIVDANVEIISSLSEVYVWASNFRVSPFVGFSSSRPDFVPDKHEVGEILEVPLDYFLNAGIVKEKPIPSKMGFLMNAPYYDLWGKTLWGATAMMVSELMQVVKRT
ncbi:MAG TPA: CoA pyrophosphatase, partial [Chitinophagaceae bacterium]|nr:CoA pyrophosphatase [Chitinophagaceae bacterium]